MEPLITIETVPISIEYVEKKSTCSSAGQLAELYGSNRENRMTTQNQPIGIRMRDTYESGQTPDRSNLPYAPSAKFSEDGKLKTPANVGNIEGDDFVFQQFGRGIENMMNVLSKSAEGGIEATGSTMEIKVVERPRVIIKYVGDPLYIPKSSDPDYVPPETEEKYQSIELNLDMKA